MSIIIQLLALKLLILPIKISYAQQLLKFYPILISLNIYFGQTIQQTGNLISEDVAEQATQAMKNVGILLEASKSSFKNVVKCIVYLVDMADFAKVNEAYAKFFDGDYPARVCIAVKQLPKGGLVEVEVIAVQDTE